MAITVIFETENSMNPRYAERQCSVRETSTDRPCKSANFSVRSSWCVQYYEKHGQPHANSRKYLCGNLNENPPLMQILIVRVYEYYCGVGVGIYGSVCWENIRRNKCCTCDLIAPKRVKRDNAHHR